MKMGTLDTVAMVLVVVGALNWGLVGLLDMNLVESLLGGSGSMLVKLVYILVGLSGVEVLWKWYGNKK
jgi:uncharacterized protein